MASAMILQATLPQIMTSDWAPLIGAALIVLVLFAAFQWEKRKATKPPALAESPTGAGTNAFRRACGQLREKLEAEGVDSTFILGVPGDPAYPTDALRRESGPGSSLIHDIPDDCAPIDDLDSFFFEASRNVPGAQAVITVVGRDKHGVIYARVDLDEPLRVKEPRIRSETDWKEPVDVFLGSDLEDGVRNPWDCRNEFARTQPTQRNH